MATLKPSAVSCLRITMIGHAAVLIQAVPPAPTGSAMGLSGARPAASSKREVHNKQLEGEARMEFSRSTPTFVCPG
jgi:hypothetical protein